MRKDNRSRDQLIRSAERRVKHLMIQALEGFENRFEDIENTRDGQMYKASLRTAFNDAMRAQRDELYDYDVEYRPLRADVDGSTVSVTRTFLETVQKIDFGFTERPYIKIYGAPDRQRVIQSVRGEFAQGIVYDEDDAVVLEIVGIEPCVNCVLPIMDKYRLHAGVREKYLAWKDELIKIYRS